MDSARAAQLPPHLGLPEQDFRSGVTLESVLVGAKPFDESTVGALDDLSDEEWDAFTAAIAE